MASVTKTSAFRKPLTIILTPEQSALYEEGGFSSWRIEETIIEDLGRDNVTEDDLIFFEHLLWKDPEELPKVREAIRHLVKGFEDEARELLIQGQELREYAERGWESEELRKRAVIEAHTKLANILLKFDSLVRQASDSGRDTLGIEAMRSKVKDIQQMMLRQSL